MSLDSRVNGILSTTPLIDGHDDLPFVARLFYKDHIHAPNFTFNSPPGLLGQVDLPRLRTGHAGGVFWSVFVECPVTDWSLPDPFPNSLYSIPVRETLQQIDVIRRLIAANPNDLQLTLTPCDVRRAFQNGRIASVLGVEGFHQIGNSAAAVRLYYSLGARYITLTHACTNAYADSAGAILVPGPGDPAERYWNGLSPRGVDMIREMNRLGMIVDLSHVSHDVMRQVLNTNVTSAPVIFSHSSAYALCPHPRNVPDDVLDSVKANGGIVMVNFYPDHISCGAPQNATMEMVADHVMHIGQRIGFQHVGLGSDFDGMEMVPAGLEDVSKTPDLVRELLSRGVTDAQAAGIVGGNVLRVWEAVERVAARMQSQGVLELEDDM